MEARCRRNNVEGQRYGVPEVWRCAARVATWRYEVLEASCRCNDVETWRFGGVEALRV